MSVQFVPLVCFVVGLLVSLSALALSFRCATSTRPPDLSLQSSARWVLGAAATCLGLLLVVTLPAGEPFSPGNTLGLGIVAGGACALCGFMMRMKLQPRPPQAIALWAAGELALCVVPVAFVLWRVVDDPTDALAGVALGQLTVRMLAGCCVTTESQAEEVLGVIGVGVAVAALLAVMHDAHGILPSATVAQRHWLWNLPVCVATGVSVVALLTNRTLDERKPLMTSAVATALSVAVCLAIALGVYHTRAVLWPLALGALVGLFLAALTSLAEPLTPKPAALGWLVVLVVLGVWSESFLRLAGYGVALATTGLLSLAGVMVALSLTPESRGSTVVRVWTRSVGLLLSVALVRVFVTRLEVRTGEWNALNNYVLAGLAVGVVIPLLLADTPLAVGDRRRVAGALLLGLSVLLIVVLTPMFFRLRASAGLMVGLAIAQAVLLVQSLTTHHAPRTTHHSPTLFVLGLGLMTAQLTPHLTEYTGLLQRPHKLALVGVMLSLLFGWFVVSLRAASRGVKEVE